MIFKKATVDSILSSINTNIADLEALAESETQAATKEREEAIRLDKAADERIAQARRATNVAAKLKALVA